MATSQEIQLRLKAIGDFSDFTGDINQVQQMINKIKMPASLKQSFDGIFTDLTKETKKYQTFLDSGFKKKGDVTGLEQSGDRINKMLQKLKGEMGKIDPSMLEQSFNVDPSKLEKLQSEMDQLKQKFSQEINTSNFKKLDSAVQDITGDMSKLSKSKAVQQFADSFKSGDIKGAEQALAQLQANLNKFKDADTKGKMGAGLEELEKLLNRMKSETGLDQITQDIQNLDQRMDQLDADELQEFINTFNQGRNSVDGMTRELDEFNQKTNQAAQSQNNFSSEIDQLKSQVSYFFGLTNAVYLLRSALQGALETVKELDATMTEAAVVTDFSVGDMWAKLPEYTKVAQDLGVSINGLYQATTLYYQQGLKTNEAMQLGIETMKMAKIAGMESTEATQAMTAALRGFNMELTETSATQVNDVYSQLAAVTAADTEQIATAMNKTASIAHSANMEFETTAALLAQIIETTQEAPETAGTAMKTIIARFSEVKSLRDSGQSKGEDSEGEGIDVNKIQTALGSVGISMEGFFAGTEGLDQILLKLAEKWDELDFSTQRYIATMAAGSRQQSRFIAMMSDYERTTELVAEASNAAGASQKQYMKTQESLESILTRLQNAWDSFLMGLANNEIIKGTVNILTELLNGVNNLLSGLPGLTKSFASLALAFAGIRVAAAVVNAAFTSIASRFAAGGKAAGVSFRKALGQEFKFVKVMVSKQTYRLPPLNIATQEASIQKLKGAYNALTVAEKQAEAAEIESSGTDMVKTKTTDRVALAQAAYKQQVVETGTALGVQSANMAMFSSLVTAGIEPTLAATLAEKGLTKEIYDQMVAKVAMMGLTGEAAEEKLKEMLITWESLTVKKAENTEDKLSLGQKLGLIATMLFGTKAKKKETLEHWKAIAAKSGETTATWALAIAEYAACIPLGVMVLLIMALIACIAIVIVAIVALVKWFKQVADSANDAKKIEKLNEQIKAVGEVADEAKQKLDDMASAKDELDQLGKTFEGLTKGSQAWKKALVENNQKVLELLNLYPKLASYVSKGLYGQMIISDEGWDALMAQTQRLYASSISAQGALNSQVENIDLDMDTEKIMAEAWSKTNASDVVGGTAGLMIAPLIPAANPLFGTTNTVAAVRQGAIDDEFQTGLMEKLMETSEFIDEADASIARGISKIVGVELPTLRRADLLERAQTGGLNYDQLQAFAAKAAEEGLSMSAGDSKFKFEQLYNELGFKGNFERVWESMENMGTSFDELAGSAHAVKLAEEARVKAVATSIAQENEIVSGSEDFGQAVTDFSSQLYADYSKKAQEAADEYTSKDNKKTTNKHNAEIIEKYAELQDMTIDEVSHAVKNEELSYETMKSVIGADDVNKMWEETMEKMVKELEKVTASKSKEEKKRIAALFSNEGLDLTQADIKAIGQFSTIEDYLTNIGIDEAVAGQMGTTMEEMTKELQENFNNASEALYDAYYSPSTFGMGKELKTQIEDVSKAFEDLGATTDLTIEQTKNLSMALAQIEIGGGNSTATVDLFDKLVAGLKGEDLNTAMALLAQTNWTSQQSINATIDSLRMLGATIDQKLVREVVEATNAVADLNLSELKAELSATKELRDSIAEKTNEGIKTFTQEEVDKLLPYGFTDKDFVMTNPDEYTFMGDTNDILLKILEDSDSILKNMVEDKGEAVEKGKKIEEWYNDPEAMRKDIWETVSSGRMYFSREGKVQGEVEGYIKGGGGFAEQIQGKSNVGIQHFYESFNKQKLDNENWQEVAEIIGFYWSNAQTSEENEQRWKKLMEDYVANKLKRQNFITEEDYAEYINTATGYGKEVNNEQMIQLAKAWQIDPSEYEGLSGKALAEFLNQYEEKYFNEGIALKLNQEEWENDAQGLIEYELTKSVGTQGFLPISPRQGLDKTHQKVLDAYINSQQGLGVAVDKTTDELRKQGLEFEDNSYSIKNLVASNHKAHQNIDNLNKVLEDQQEALNGDNLSAYNAALEQIAAVSKQVFGAEVGTEFVQTHIELFKQLTEGGEIAQQAFETIGKYLAEDYVASLYSGIDATQAINAAIDNLPTDIRIGAVFDATQAINSLVALGVKAEDAIAIMDKMGYDVQYRLMWRDEDGTLVEKPSMLNGRRGTAVKIYTGLKRDSSGTGKVSFSGSGGGSSDKWENPYDEFYNTIAKINEELRTREQLERRYARLLERNAATAKEMIELNKQQLSSLQTELEDREKILAGRARQMDEIMVKYSDVSKYAKYDKEARQVVINWDELNSLNGSTNEDLTSRVEEYISQLESKEEEYEEQLDAIEEIKDGVWEIYNQGKDEYFVLEDTIKEAIIAERQREIDELSEINDSITDTNSKILDSMQEQIDVYRQNRDNEKAEEEIMDKQRRLAYLSQDTSGANALEILNLQKEIEEGQQDYTDTLIDQKISELQKQNDQAAEQRQQQIDLLKAQLDYYSKSADIWDEVNYLMQEGLNEQFGLLTDSRLSELLKDSANFEGLSKLGKMNWMNELNSNIAQALSWLQSGAMQSIYGEGKEISFITGDGKTLATGTIDANGNVITNGQIFSGSSFSISPNGMIYSSETNEQAAQNHANSLKKEEQEEATQSGVLPWPSGLKRPSELTKTVTWGSPASDVESVQTALSRMGYFSGVIDGVYGTETREAIKKFQTAFKLEYPNEKMGSPDGVVGTNTRNAFRIKQYQTGGLADFTGPAWLDGTKSRPEYILNADQTKAFFTLVDVLSGLNLKESQTSQNTGDTSYDIDINVESIGNDYDVERLASKVKSLINEDARYRNNNAINLMR